LIGGRGGNPMTEQKGPGHQQQKGGPQQGQQNRGQMGQQERRQEGGHAGGPQQSQNKEDLARHEPGKQDLHRQKTDKGQGGPA